ncbi:hypothetical protein JCM15754A_03580 [Prevotella aurantiaca JCM 15754]|uniref:hypothetical protein n=1 Tax=Prevotella aurantiaca TaxID=596085 RepID=UPI000469DF33|nr:hypothetical protein [Prevotella aurantiaca]
MKKLLLLAFAAIIGMSVSAQESLLTERPAGIIKVYDRSGKGIKLQQGDDGSLEMTSLNLADASDFEVVFLADNKTVYVKNPIAALPATFSDVTNRWVKGNIEGNKITIPHKSLIFSIKTDQDQTVNIYMGYYGIENSQASPLNPTVDVTYTIDGDKIILEAPGNDKTYVLSCISADDSWFRMSEYTGALYILNKEKTTNDVKAIEENSSTQAVNETYYDISGRKLSKSVKGITIKTIKYKNGTQKSTKSINN